MIWPDLYFSKVTLALVWPVGGKGRSRTMKLGSHYSCSGER